MYEQEKLEGKSMADAAKEEERKKLEDREEAAQEALRKKQEDLLKLKEEMKNKGDDIDINMDIDSMPDCRLKYEIIVKRAKERQEKFTDAQF